MWGNVGLGMHPQGATLLTACFATGRAAGEGVKQYLNVAKNSP